MQPRGGGPQLICTFVLNESDKSYNGTKGCGVLSKSYNDTKGWGVLNKSYNYNDTKGWGVSNKSYSGTKGVGRFE
jgi:hypothetical protein